MKERSTTGVALGAPPWHPPRLELGAHLHDPGLDPATGPDCQRPATGKEDPAPPTSPRPALHLGGCAGNQALRSRSSQSVPSGRLSPRPRRSPGRVLAQGGPGVHGHTNPFLLCLPARLLACSAQRDIIHGWAPKPCSCRPGSRLGPAPGGREPELGPPGAPAGRGTSVPGHLRLLITLRTER